MRNEILLPNFLTAQDLERTRGFIEISSGIPQLAKARTHAILLLWYYDCHVAKINPPRLGLREIEEVLKTSDKYAGDPVLCHPFPETHGQTELSDAA
jgi:hypothetical protein